MTITRGHNLSYVAADGVVNDVAFSEVPGAVVLEDRRGILKLDPSLSHG